MSVVGEFVKKCTKHLPRSGDSARNGGAEYPTPLQLDTTPMYVPKSSKAVFAVTSALVALIWLVGLFVPAHVALDPPRWSPFPSGEGAWTVRGWPGAATFHEGVTLESSAAGINRLSFAVPLERPVAPEARLRLSGRLVEEPRQGESWATASLGVGFVTAAGDTFGYRNLRMVPRRATTLERFSEVVEWPVDAVEARVSLHSRPGAPTFSLVEGSAELVERNGLYGVALALIAGVAAFWLLVLYRFARAQEAVRSLLVPGLLTALIVAGVMLSAQALRPMMMPLLVTLEGVFGIARDEASVALRTGGHAFAFFLLTLGLLSLRRRLHVRRTHLTLFAALVAVGSEGLQSHLAGRNGSLQDVFVDLVGVVFGLIVFQLVAGGTRRRKRRRRRREEVAARAALSAEEAAAIGAPVPAAVPALASASETDVMDATVTCSVDMADLVAEPEETQPTMLLQTMALRAPDIDLGSPEPAAAGREKRRRSRRRSGGVRKRLSRALSFSS